MSEPPIYFNPDTSLSCVHCETPEQQVADDTAVSGSTANFFFSLFTIMISACDVIGFLSNTSLVTSQAVVIAGPCWVKDSVPYMMLKILYAEARMGILTKKSRNDGIE